MTNEELWRTALGEIELYITKAGYNAWMKQTNIVNKKENEVTVGVPNTFVKEWLENKYNKFILRALRNNCSEIKEVKYVITPYIQVFSEKLNNETNRVNQLEFDNLKVNKETNLNSKYTFENFIVGSFNELAHAAALAVSQNLGNTYNPLFIYGGVGLGKTHLLQAIGNQVIKNNPGIKVKYVSSEKFTNEVVDGIRNNTMKKFKESYRKNDVLIIDDVQFIAGKDKTEEELFHTFNELYEKNKQIVLSSDRPPKAIPIIEDRLRSRFLGGMMADINFPDFETRVAILKSKSNIKDAALSEEIIEHIASNIQRNIRELEGALNQISTIQRLSNKDITLEEVKKIINKSINSPKKIATFKQILKSVADFYELGEKDILQKNRRQEIVKPRQVVMYLLREEVKYSFPRIGQKLGKDHTTAIHAHEKINNEIKNDQSFFEEIDLIKQKIYNECTVRPL